MHAGDCECTQGHKNGSFDKDTTKLCHCGCFHRRCGCFPDTDGRRRKTVATTWAVRPFHQAERGADSFTQEELSTHGNDEADTDGDADVRIQ
eukprot:scaffold17437_cov173-Amphora_coffeaeformis.AAC.6